MPCWCNGKCPHAGKPAELLKAGRAGAALVAMRTALTAAPNCPEVNLMLAGMLGRNNRGQAAEVHVERAALMGDPGRVAQERGIIFRLQAKLQPAAEAFAAAIEAAPDNALLAANMIDTGEVAGELEQAKILADGARARFPESGQVRRAAAIVAASMGDDAGAVEILASSGEERTPLEWLDLGRYHEKLGDHGAAWSAWMTGKHLARDKLQHIYRADYYKKHFAALADSASSTRRQFMREAPPVTDGGPTPIFVCGFPRSGTTLAETILSGHSAVLAGDELMGLTDVIEAMPAFLKVRAPYPAALIATSLGENADMPQLLRDLYLLGGRRRAGWEKRKGRVAQKYFTDKMPLNEIHLPLIRLLFPAAPIFRMERHPLDVMVSCMAQWLPHGGFYASSLEDCARHFLAVDSLMMGYRESMGAGLATMPLPIKYERLVTDGGATIRGMLQFAGLKFERATMAPHKNPRTARTLSYNQVRQPISAASVGRWKPYREQLAPAVEILRPILERDGYEF